MLQVFINGDSTNASKLFVYNGIDFQLIQKIFMCYFLMIFLHKYEDIKSPALTLLASTSFAVYFLHFWFIYFTVVYLYNHPSSVLLTFMQPLMWLLYAIIFTAFSVMIALLIKKAFPSKSKYITGYWFFRLFDLFIGIGQWESPNKNRLYIVYIYLIDKTTYNFILSDEEMPKGLKKLYDTIIDKKLLLQMYYVIYLAI